MLLIAMAGLPGTGKSTLARALAPHLRASVLDKDVMRASMFGELVDYTREQDDLVCAAMYAVVEHIARERAADAVILDGRTYSKRYQVEELRKLAARTGASLAIAECTCSPETARARLARDFAHVAQNRSFDLYRSLAAAAEPIDGERLVLATDSERLEQLVERCIDWLRDHGARIRGPR